MLHHVFRWHLSPPTRLWQKLTNSGRWPSTKNGTKQISKGNRAYDLEDLCIGRFATHHVPIRSTARKPPVRAALPE